MRSALLLPEQSEGKTKVIRQQHLPFTVLKPSSETTKFSTCKKLQQHLPFTVCVEGCETAEEQSDDEVRTSQVPERREGKTKVIKQQYLPFTVLKQFTPASFCFVDDNSCNNTYRLRY